MLASKIRLCDIKHNPSKILILNMIIGEPSVKKLPYNIEKRCQGLKVTKFLSFKGTFQNTLKYLNDGSLAYPAGNNLIIEKGKDMGLLKGHDNEISAVAVFNSGNYIVTGQLGSASSKNYESPLLIWDTKSKQLVKQLPGLKDGIRNVVISRDDSLIAAVSLKNHLMLWSTKSMAMVHSKTFEFKVVLHFFAQNLVLSIDKGLYQMSFATPNMPVQTAFTLPSTGLPRNYTSVALYQPKTYFIGTEGGEICVFDKGVFKLVFNLGKGKVSSILCDKNDVYVIVAEELVKLSYQNNFVEKKRINLPQALSIVGTPKQLLVQAKGKLYAVLPDTLNFEIRIDSHSSPVAGLDSNGKIIVTQQANGLAIVRDVTTWGIITRCSHSKPLEACCVTLSEDNHVISGWIDGTIKAYQITQKPHSAMTWEMNAHKQRTSTIFVNENYILSGGQDATIRIWARKTRQLLQQISVHQKTISKVFPDAKIPNYIHSCSHDKSVHTYDLKTDKKVNFHQAKNGQILDMGQRKDNGDLVTCGANIPISYWDLKNFAANDQIEFPYKLLCLSVSPSGKYAVFGCENGQLYIFELKTKNFLGGVQGHSQAANCVKWINDNTIVSGSNDSSVVIWNIGVS